MKIMKALKSNMNIQSFDFKDIHHSGTFSTYNHSMHDIDIIADALSSTTTLKQLTFRAEHPRKEIYDALHRNSSITTLVISNSSLPLTGQFLPQNIEKLEILCWKPDVSLKKYQNLASNILNNNTLHTIKISHGAHVIDHILNAISPILISRPHIQTLILAYDIHTVLNKTNITNIANSKVKSLEITNGGSMIFDDNNISLLTDVLLIIANHDNIESLILKNRKIGPYDSSSVLRLSSAVAHLITNCRSIRDLALIGFRFDDECGTNIIKALTQSQTRQLVSLDLTNNSFSARTLQQFTQFDQFQKLVLDVNTRLPDDDGSLEKAYATYISKNNNLTHLSLTNNSFTAGYIFDVLRYNDTLTYINLVSNRYDNDVVGKIIDVIKNNKSLTTLYIGSDTFSKKSIQKIINSVQYNSTLINIRIEVYDDSEHLKGYINRNRYNIENLYTNLLTTLLNNISYEISDASDSDNDNQDLDYLLVD